jgi:hypothetical protein
MPDVLSVPLAAQASAHFDVEAATNAYLAEIPASARSKSDAYLEGRKSADLPAESRAIDSTGRSLEFEPAAAGTLDGSAAPSHA